MSQLGHRQTIADFIRAEANPPDKFSHQPRLYELAKQLAGDQPFDDDVLYAGAWLHDIGVFIGHRPEDPAALAKWDNVAYALKEAPLRQAVRECPHPAKERLRKRLDCQREDGYGCSQRRLESSRREIRNASTRQEL